MHAASRLHAPGLVGLIAAALLLAACGSSAGGGDGGNRRSVVASFYPLAWVTERVAGDAFEVTNLTTPGGEPHDLELGIAETAAIDGAEVVVHQGGFQPAVDQAVANVGEARVVDAAEVVDLRGNEEHDGHDDGDLDPHFWLDPLLMADLADEVAATLAEVDPAGAEDFEANAADLRAELERLDAAYTRGLADCERDTAVVSHDAFGYLERYGIHFEPIAGLTPGAEPTPADLGRLQELIREEGVTTVFSERLASPAMARTLAEDVGVQTAVLDPVEGLTDETSGSDYVALMEDNLAALQEAGGC
jgi:zinc transport system substrate-binding protein